MSLGAWDLVSFLDLQRTLSSEETNKADQNSQAVTTTM